MNVPSSQATADFGALGTAAETLHRIGLSLTSKLTLSDVKHAIMEQVALHFKPGLWALLLFDEHKKKLRFELIVGEGTEQLQGSWCNVDVGVVGDAFREGRPAEIEALREQTVFDGDDGLPLRNVLALPLLRGERRIGVLVLCNFAQMPSGNDRALLRALCDYSAIAVENARQLQRVRELSVTDDVTSLYNARYLEQALEQEFSRCKRSGSALSVIFLDLDYFKVVNDGHGHLVGSEVLRETANILRQSLRATDIATRYGGDEFVLILPDTSQAEALLVAERCLNALRAHTFGMRHGVECKITASFGIATIPDDTGDRVDLIRLADQAMYYVKEHDRNNIATASQVK